MKKINFLVLVISVILLFVCYLVTAVSVPGETSDDLPEAVKTIDDKLSLSIENGKELLIGNIVDPRSEIDEGTIDRDSVKIKSNMGENSKVDISRENEETKISGENDFSLKIKDKDGEYDEYTGFKEGEKSSIELNKESKIIEADLKIDDDTPEDKGGSDLVMGNMEFNAPEGSRVLLDRKKDSIDVSLKGDTQITKEPKKKNEEDEETKDLRYLALKDFVKLPDSIAEQLGFSGKDVSFKGILSHNGNNWFLDENHAFDVKIDGKMVSFANLNGMHVIDPIDGKIKSLNGINPTSEVFFSKESFNDAVSKGYKGAYFVLDNEGVGAGSNNELDGNSLKLGEENPWGIKVAKNGHVAGVSMKNSNFFINKNSQIVTKGNVIIDDDYIYYKTDSENNKLFFNQGSRVPGFGEFTKFKDTTNSPLEMLPFKENGDAFPSNSKVMIGMSTSDDPTEPTNFKMVSFEGNEAEIGRVSFGEVPVESSGKTISPVKEPVIAPEIGSNVPIPETGIEEIPEDPKPKPTPTPEPTPSILKIAGNVVNPSSFKLNVPRTDGTTDVLDMFKSVGPVYDPKIHTKGIVLEFSASWCKPCLDLAPLIHNVATQNKDVKVIPIDGDLNPDLLKKYKIKQYPTAVRIDPKTGKQLDKASSKLQLIGFLNRLGIKY
ncbi:thioredoxin family protein [Candidatus Pacearchaeota archaeon]|nr:thioredoxin family protein [Candidatus Pacearchaeota archaeon]